MTALLSLDSPLRLPGTDQESTNPMPAADLRERLEELVLRRFGGRVELRTTDCLAEVLLREGELLAVAVNRPETTEPLQGQDALTSLIEQTPREWSSSIEPIEPRLLAALAGLGAEPEVCELQNVSELRALLRDLAKHGQEGVLELNDGEHWGRTLVAGGWVLGAYSDTMPQLEPTLAPLGELLLGTLPQVRWYPASGEVTLELPRPAIVEVAPATAEVERLVIWSMSRFEGSWGRARENGPNVDALRDGLAQMLDTLLSLAIALEAANGDNASLETRLADLELETAAPRPIPLLDSRLIGLGPSAACPLLLELVIGTLQRIVNACSETTLAECCRQAALALAAEFPSPSAPTAALAQNGASQ
jgi:hypothetical protein